MIKTFPKKFNVYLYKKYRTGIYIKSTEVLTRIKSNMYMYVVDNKYMKEISSL